MFLAIRKHIYRMPISDDLSDLIGPQVIWSAGAPGRRPGVRSAEAVAFVECLPDPKPWVAPAHSRQCVLDVARRVALDRTKARHVLGDLKSLRRQVLDRRCPRP